MIPSKLALYNTQAIRSCEEKALQAGLAEDELMEAAGREAFALIKQRFPRVQHLAIYCGGGNNAGDGYVLARLAQEDGYKISLYQYKTVDYLPPVAQRAAIAALETELNCYPLDEILDSDAELIVDALLGLGLNNKVEGLLATAITQINDSNLPVLALDLPSGLDADRGCFRGVCVRATLTLTFIGLKLGLVTLDGPDYCGEIICHDLHLKSYLESIKPSAYLLDNSLTSLLKPRLKNSHKGHFGRVLIIGSGLGMPGASYLTAKAALRVGAGTVTIATRREYAQQMLPSLPEAMIYGIEEIAQLTPLLSQATVCVIGPGLGEDDWAEALFNKAIAAQLPMVIDASALKILAKNPQHDDNWILTPHPGEAAALLDCSTTELQNNRFNALRFLQKRYGGTIVLKGMGTLIGTDKGESFLCGAGNPGMATAGMGDLLTGIIAGLCAQQIALGDAAKLGVWLHATAADQAAQILGERGLVASDLFPYLQRLVNGLISRKIR